MEIPVDKSEEIIKTAEGLENSNHLGEMFQGRILDFRSELIKHPGLSKTLIAGVVLAAHIIIGATPEFNLVAANMDSVIDSDSVDTLVGALAAGDDPDSALYNERWDNPGSRKDAWLGDEAGKTSLEQQGSVVKPENGEKIIIPGSDRAVDWQEGVSNGGERGMLTPTGKPLDDYWSQADTPKPSATEEIELIRKTDNVASRIVENPAVPDSGHTLTRVGNFKKPEGVEVGTIETGQPKGTVVGGDAVPGYSGDKIESLGGIGGDNTVAIKKVVNVGGNDPDRAKTAQIIKNRILSMFTK